MTDCLRGFSGGCELLTGLSSVEYLPFVRINPALWEELSADGLWTGHLGSTTTLLKLPLYPYGIQLSYRIGENEHGTYYEYVVSAQILGDSPRTRTELHNTKNLRHLLKVTDLDKKAYLLGSYENPCRFFYTFAKNGVGGQNGYSIEFRCVSPTPIFDFA
jgi:hypothetical protein